MHYKCGTERRQPSEDWRSMPKARVATGFGSVASNNFAAIAGTAKSTANGRHCVSWSVAKRLSLARIGSWRKCDRAIPLTLFGEL